ncbi:Neuronal membrane glycoprotein M6-b [Mactra antiquata]
MSEFSNLITSTSFNDGNDASKVDNDGVKEFRPKPGSRRSRSSANSSRKTSAHSENCLERTLHCLSHVPCGSIVAWILLFLGLGGVTGSLLIGVFRTRDLLEDDRILWFMEFTLIGVVSGMFVIGTCLLIVGHFSSEPNSRHAFNTSRKNLCGRGLNIFMLILTYILLVAWLLTSAILIIPVGAFTLLIYLYEVKDVKSIDLANYGFESKVIKGDDLERFRNEGQDLLICYGAAYLCAVFIIISLIHFLMCISANITHLRDARFATLNAYEEAEDAQNAKQLNDTTM